MPKRAPVLNQRRRRRTHISLNRVASERGGIINVWGAEVQLATGTTMRSGCLFALSTQQIRILDLLTTRFRIMRRDDLPWILFKLRPSRRGRERPLTGSERASISRTIRRLKHHDLVTISQNPFRMGATELGTRLISLCRSQPLWRTYSARLHHFDADER